MPEPSGVIEKHTEDLKKLREWLSKQPHLPQNIDELLLFRFLHTTNFSLEQTKHLIDLFYTIRSQAPEIFSNRDPTQSALVEIFKIVDFVPLPTPTKNNDKLFVVRLADPDPDKYSFADSLKAFFMAADVRLVSETVVYDGLIAMFDMEGYSLRHLTKVTLPILKKYMVYTQEAHPIRLKQIHIINASSFLDRCLALTRPLMNSTVASILHFHLPNTETLYDYVPRDLLPVEYGGTVGKLSEIKKEFVQKIMSKRDFFLDESRWKVDESRRPIENSNGRQLCGIQGSFRSLNID